MNVTDTISTEQLQKCTELTALNSKTNTNINIFPEIEEQDKNSNIFIKQFIAFLACFLLNICGGATTGYSAILFPQLEEKNSTIVLTTSQQSWIVSAAPLTMIFGCFLSGWSMEYFGRKKTLRYSGIISLLGWIVIYISKTIECLLVGKTITGFFVGYSGLTATCFISEVTSPKYRSIFLAGISLGIATGLLIIHIMGTFLAWQTCALIVCTPCIIQLLILIAVPDSYVWLQRKEKFREAQAAFEWYTGDTTPIGNTIMEPVRQPKQNYKHFFRKEFLTPVIIMNVLFATSQFSGNNVVGFYAVSIMQKTVPTLNKYVSMIIYDAIRVLMSIIACVLTRKFRIRVLTFVSGCGTVLSLYLLALFTYLSGVYPNNSIFATVPFAFLISYIVFISIGIVPLPWSLGGELLPPQNKGVGGGIATAVNFLSFFIVIKTSPGLFEAYGTAFTFGLYGSITLLGCLILYVILPETKNKTLEEIQDSFK